MEGNQPAAGHGLRAGTLGDSGFGVASYAGLHLSTPEYLTIRAR